MNIHKKLTLILMISFSLNLQAQKMDPDFDITSDDLTKINAAKTLFVVLQEVDPAIIKKLDNKNMNYEKEFYYQFVKDFNNKLKKTIPTNWPHQVDIQFKTLEEISQLKKETDPNSLVMYLGFSVFSSGEPPGTTEYYTYPTSIHGLTTMLQFYSSNNYHSPGHASVHRFETFVGITTIDKMNFKRPPNTVIFEKLLHSVNPTEADLTMTLNYISWLISERAKNPATKISVLWVKNVNQLKDKILVIPQSLLITDYPYTLYNGYNEFVDSASIEQLYPFQFEIVSDSIYEQIIVNQKKGYAYLHVDVYPDDIINMAASITDAENGDLLLLAKPTSKIADDIYFMYFLHKNHFESISFYIKGGK